MRLANLAFAFLSIILMSSSASLTTGEVSLGNSAPDFTISNEETSVRLQDLKGKEVMLNFWSVKDALSRERNARLSREAEKMGKEFIGICVDTDTELAQEVIRRDGLTKSNQYMSSKVRRGNPCKSYETSEGLRAFEINKLGTVTNVI